MKREANWLVAATWLAASTVAAASCTDDGETGDPASDAGPCEELARLGCADALACSCFEADALPDCENLFALSCRQRSQDHIDAGYQAWDLAAVEQCLAVARVAYTQCDPQEDLEAACRELTYGIVQAGETCEGSDDCVAGLSCIGDVCAERIPVGEPCPTGFGCEPESYCGSEGVCRPCEPLGAPCTEPHYGGCCAEPLYCEPETSTCQPEPAALAVGEACAPYDTVPPHCDVGLFCSSVSATCQPEPTEGQPCEHPGMVADCVSGLYCAADGVCRPLLHTGDPCESDEACESRHCVHDACDASVCPHG